MDKTTNTFVPALLANPRRSPRRPSRATDTTPAFGPEESLHAAAPQNPPQKALSNNPILIVLLLLILIASAPASLQAAAPNQLTPSQIAEGWINLFDGETLFGWTPTSNANWKVEDGAITVSEGEAGFLATNAEFADYELHLEFKAPPTTNSGVFLRTPLAPTDPAKDCVELNIAPENNPFPTASLVGRHRTIISRGKDIDAWDGHWHAFHIHVEGTKVQTYLDRMFVGTFEGTNQAFPGRGRISLQFREGPVAFRSIRLKPLGLKPMLNGKDLTGWNTANTESSKFEVVTQENEVEDSSGSLPLVGRAGEGGEASAGEPHSSTELRVTNGRGILETDASYGDFIMQLEAFVDGDGLNSGVFFRSIPREYANGYESQIHNGYKDNDPIKPTDFGTGAIYRRVAARRIVSKDREWFTKTIVATGPHIAVWVNGYQVTDWTDDRPPHENPRSGLRTEPGTISLQGHDPTTNLRFRNLRIVELPEAKPIAN